MKKRHQEADPSKLLQFPPYAKKLFGIDVLDCLELMAQTFTSLDAQWDTTRPRLEWMPEIKATGFFKDLKILQTVADKLIESLSRATKEVERLYGAERGQAKVEEGVNEIFTRIVNQEAVLRSPLTQLCLQELRAVLNIRLFANAIRNLKNTIHPQPDAYSHEKLLFQIIQDKLQEKARKGLPTDHEEISLLGRMLDTIFWIRYLQMNVKGRFTPAVRIRVTEDAKQMVKRLRYTEIVPFEGEVLCQHEEMSPRAYESINLRVGADMHPFSLVDVSVKTGAAEDPVPTQVEVSLSVVHGDLVLPGFGYASLLPLFEAYGEEDTHLHLKRSILQALEESLEEGLLKERDWLAEWEEKEASELALAEVREESHEEIGAVVPLPLPVTPGIEAPNNGRDPTKRKGRRQHLNNVSVEDFITAIKNFGVEVRREHGSSHFILQRGDVDKNVWVSANSRNLISAICSAKRTFGITTGELLDALLEV